jgi:tetratricopeptide (TPR) repeat protein
MQAKTKLAVAAWLLVSSIVFAGEEKKYKLRPIDELYKIMEASEVTYTIMSIDKLKDLKPEQFIDIYFPVKQSKHAFPWIKTTSKSRELHEYPFHPEALKLLKKAEPLFKKRRFEEAMALYKKALSHQKDCYVAMSHIGDCFLLSGKPQKAIEYYDQAIAANPDDHRTFFYKGNALTALKRWKEAKEAYIDALTRFPRHPGSLSVLIASQNQFLVDVRRNFFLPRALARREGDRVAIYLDMQDEHGMAWTTYAICKAVWIGEPEHRKEASGKSDSIWSNLEEQECIGNMMAKYLSQRLTFQVRPKIEFERIFKTKEDGYFLQFLIYEIGSRMIPDVMIMADQEQRIKMKEFIRRYVVVDKEI